MAADPVQLDRELKFGPETAPHPPPTDEALQRSKSLQPGLSGTLRRAASLGLSSSQGDSDKRNSYIM